MKRLTSLEDLDRKESLAFGEYLPKSGQLLMADRLFSEEKGRMVTQIVLVTVQTGARDVLVDDCPGLGNPVLSPDGKRLLYLAAAPGGRQVYVMDLKKRESRAVTHMRFGCMDPLWSPDGEKILFTSMCSDAMEDEWLQTMPDPGEAAAYARERAKEPVVIEDFGYKFDGMGFAQPEVMQLFVVDADGNGLARRITQGHANFMHAAWAPDSQKIVCESNLYCDKAIGIAMDLLLIDIRTRKMQQVTRERMLVSYPNPVRPVFTRDGQYVVIGILDYADMKHLGGTYPSVTLHKVSLDGRECIPISEKTEDCPDTVQFAYNAGCGQGLEKVRISSDGKWVLFHASCRGECRIWKVALDGSRKKPVAVTEGKYAHNGMGVPQKGQVLISESETSKPESYWLLHEKTGEKTLLYQSNREWVRNVALSQAEDFFFETLDGCSRVHGFCLPPQGLKKGEKAPCIVYVHGGPHPFYTYGFDMEMQMFAGSGFGVLFCNPRGSSGYGDEHRQLSYAFDGSAYTDIMQFVHEAAQRYAWIDENRLGLTGGSYGGYMTNYAATRTKKFKAYITQRAVVNELFSYASSDMQGNSKDYPTYGEFMDHAVEHSVICGMEKVNAPFLIMHGMDDLRCPVEGAHQLFVALKDSHPEDFPVKMILYPHVAHNQPSDPAQRMHYYRAMLAWFQKYL
ncbi:MAG: S9 family peptidase [Clostridia bacterium]|nr:S9 family peptidase [Clostridia bacterium]